MRLFRLTVFFLTVIFPARFISAQILAEAFRSIGCVNCIDPDARFETFITNNPQYKISIVYIHNNISTSDDPFYKVSKADVDARMATSFYDVESDPTAFMSGFSAGSGQSSESNWETLAADPKTAQYPGTLTATASIDATGKLQIDLHADGSSAGVQVKPYIMLVESGIHYTNTEGYGNPPGNIWNNIFRAMIPGSQGPFVLSGAMDLPHYTYDPTGKPWNLTNCKLYAFLQEVTAQSDKVSHAVDAFTVAKITMAGVNDNHSFSTSLSAPIPNPAQTFSRIPFHLAHSANVKIIISDELGREIATPVNSFISENESSAVFMPKASANGIFYARMYVDGAFAGMQKIVFEP